ncbi:MAG TPA: tRNA (cytidine(56)-2'-O)-methyltransferase [Thermofilum sp.]|nr:tRNA (cytidine(56)-2'-O)-methyltransferase [Thermofilum sp.]
MKVYVLRLGHRKGRDERASTHVALVARAFGSDGIIYIGDVEKSVFNSIGKVVKNWGGEFKVMKASSYKEVIKKWKNEGGIVVHLTMYGENIESSDVLRRIKEVNKDILIIVGAGKVPRDVYEMADFNVAIGNQPHSEIAALAVFLDRLFEGKELTKEFTRAKIKIIPSKRGKRVIGVKFGGKCEGFSTSS